MSEYKIAVMVGSLRKDSLNRRLANAIIRLAPRDFSFEFADISELPLYNQEDDAFPVDSVKRLKAQIAAADGVLFVTPEYNRSIPGILKNAIDQGSRPHGHNSWSGKPAGVLGISPGATGTSMAQQHLRNVLAHLDMPTLCRSEAFVQMRDGLFDDAGNIGAASATFMQAWMDKYVVWVRQHVS